MILKFGGLESIRSFSSVNHSIVKLEAPAVRYFIPSLSQVVRGNREAVPWAWNSYEISTKAFLVRSNARSADDGNGLAYLFIDHDGMICQAAFSGGAPVYESRKIEFKSDGMNVIIYENGIRMTDVYAPG